jgi:hypothetical protein
LRWEIGLWLLIALLAGVLLGAALMFAATEHVPPDCSFQNTPGNWQPDCATYIRTNPETGVPHGNDQRAR